MIHRIVLLLAALLLAAPAQARTILFVGNSFTFGAGTPVVRFNAERVTDLNGEGIGGVPAIYDAFARKAGLDWQVSLETSPGKDLAWHLANRRPVFEQTWDVVLLQGYSTLDRAAPGDPTRHIAAAREIAGLLRAANPKVRILLVSTWSRADLTYRTEGRWYGKSIYTMGQDLAAANCSAVDRSAGIDGAIPVGLAWNRAMRSGLADPNPYDGITPGQFSLWGTDNYHASVEGYYLEALVIFGAVNRFDPQWLGKREQAASTLQIAPERALALQRTAAQELRKPACR